MVGGKRARAVEGREWRVARKDEGKTGRTKARNGRTKYGWKYWKGRNKNENMRKKGNGRTDEWRESEKE